MIESLPVSASRLIPDQDILIIVAFVDESSTGVFILTGTLSVKIVRAVEYAPKPTSLIAAT